MYKKIMIISILLALCTQANAAPLPVVGAAYGVFADVTDKVKSMASQISGKKIRIFETLGVDPAVGKNKRLAIFYKGDIGFKPENYSTAEDSQYYSTMPIIDPQKQIIAAVYGVFKDVTDKTPKYLGQKISAWKEENFGDPYVGALKRIGIIFKGDTYLRVSPTEESSNPWLLSIPAIPVLNLTCPTGHVIINGACKDIRCPGYLPVKTSSDGIDYCAAGPEAGQGIRAPFTDSHKGTNYKCPVDTVLHGIWCYKCPSEGTSVGLNQKFCSPRSGELTQVTLF